MINTLVSFDDQDYRLGEYFEQSNNTLIGRITNDKVKFYHLNGNNCTIALINQAIANYNQNNFIFIAFSHGDNEALTTSSERYVCLENIDGFYKSLFYTSACSCSVELGPKLIENGCHSFIGYYDEVHVHPSYYNDFIDCEIHAIVEFFNSKKTIGEAYLSMHDKYEEVILRLLEGSIEDAVIASTLAKNQRALRILGNEEMILDDFFVNI